MISWLSLLMLFLAFKVDYHTCRTGSALDCGGSTPPCIAPLLENEESEKAASSRRSPRRPAH